MSFFQVKNIVFQILISSSPHDFPFFHAFPRKHGAQHIDVQLRTKAIIILILMEGRSLKKGNYDRGFWFHYCSYDAGMASFFSSVN